jgi:phosphate-selective porin OprO/OprP
MNLFSSIVFALVAAPSAAASDPAVSVAAATTSSVPPTPSAVVVTAAPGQGLKAVAGEDFSILVRGRIQARAEAERSEDGSRVGFQVRRLRLVMSGDAVKKLFSYNVQLGLAPRDVESDLPNVTRDAWIAWNISRPFRLRIGQMKVPFDRQRIVSSASMQFAERADVVNELTLDRDIGVVAFSAPLGDVFSYQVGVFGGDGRNRLNADDGVLATARAQWTPLGAFDDDLIEADLVDDDRPRLALAAGLGFNAGTPRARSTLGAFRPDDRIDYLHATADVFFKQRGFSLLVQGIGRAATGVASTTSKARSALGGFVQLGMMLDRHAEVVGRCGHIEPLELLVDNEDDLVRSNELRVGFNYYVLGHELKVSNDIGATLPAGGPVTIDAHVMTQIAF